MTASSNSLFIRVGSAVLSLNHASFGTPSVEETQSLARLAEAKLGAAQG
jgi:hypothetical protein